jgi:hypothetical protein
MIKLSKSHIWYIILDEINDFNTKKTEYGYKFYTIGVGRNFVVKSE